MPCVCVCVCVCVCETGSHVSPCPGALILSVGDAGLGFVGSQFCMLLGLTGPCGQLAYQLGMLLVVS